MVGAELDEGISEVEGLQEKSLETLDLKRKIFYEYTSSLTSMILLLDISLISELTTCTWVILLSIVTNEYNINSFGANFLFLGFRYWNLSQAALDFEEIYVSVSSLSMCIWNNIRVFVWNLVKDIASR